MSVGKLGTASIIKVVTISGVKCVNIHTKWDTHQVINSLKSVQVTVLLLKGLQKKTVGLSGLFGC